MFDIGWSELLLIGIVALIAIGPKELPGALRTLGQWMGKLRRMASEFQGQFQEAMREAELADLKKQVDEMTTQAQSYANFDPVGEVRKEFESTQQQIESAMAGQPPADAASPPAVDRDRRVVHRGPGRRGDHDSAGSGSSGWRSAKRGNARHARTDRSAVGAGRGPSRARCRPARCRGQAGMTDDKHDEQDDIEASKAPLMDHLIELRSRLIKALIAFFAMFVVCFVFSTQIFNVLVWPYAWVAGVENSKMIYTALLELFFTHLKVAMFGAAFLSFPVVASQVYMFVAPGLYRHERKAFLPYLVATPFFFALGSVVVYFLVMPMLIRFSLSMEQPGEGQGRRPSRCCPRSVNISHW